MVLQWGASLLTLCGFGLAMGLNPALYASTGDLLARNIDVGRRLGWMLLGLALGATVLLLVFRSFDPTTLVTTLRGSLDTALLNRTLDLIVGTIFLVSATAVLIWRARVHDFPKKPTTGSKPRASAAGASTWGASLPTASGQPIPSPCPSQPLGLETSLRCGNIHRTK